MTRRTLGDDEVDKGCVASKERHSAHGKHARGQVRGFVIPYQNLHEAWFPALYVLLISWFSYTGAIANLRHVISL